MNAHPCALKTRQHFKCHRMCLHQSGEAMQHHGKSVGLGVRKQCVGAAVRLRSKHPAPGQTPNSIRPVGNAPASRQLQLTEMRCSTMTQLYSDCLGIGVCITWSFKYLVSLILLKHILNLCLKIAGCKILWKLFESFNFLVILNKLIIMFLQKITNDKSSSRLSPPMCLNGSGFTCFRRAHSFKA